MSFFNAINPLHSESGTSYRAIHNMNVTQGYYTFLPSMRLAACYANHKISDRHFIDYIQYAFQDECNIWESFLHTYRAIIGNHYDLMFMGLSYNVLNEQESVGVKGLLDVFILPLISRQILSNVFNKRYNWYVMMLAFLVAGPIEIARISIAFVLTLLATPIVFCVHFFKPNFEDQVYLEDLSESDHDDFDDTVRHYVHEKPKSERAFNNIQLFPHPRTFSEAYASYRISNSNVSNLSFGDQLQSEFENILGTQRTNDSAFDYPSSSFPDKKVSLMVGFLSENEQYRQYISPISYDKLIQDPCFIQLKGVKSELTHWFERTEILHYMTTDIAKWDDGDSVGFKHPSQRLRFTQKDIITRDEAWKNKTTKAQFDEFDQAMKAAEEYADGILLAQDKDSSCSNGSSSIL